MSGAALPRRFLAWIPALAAVALAATAQAQDPGSDPRAVTVVGADARARRCVTQVNAGDVSDRTLTECARALRYPRLTREAEVIIRVNRGVALLRRQEYQAALEDFDAVIALSPRHAEAHLNRGAALVQLHQPGPAVTAITEALSLGVREPHKAYYNRAAAREAMRDLRGAFEDYSTALEIQPDWGPANAELARFARARRDHLAGVLEEPDAE
jgi:tetratricopeptide (TPR) repeat protein